VDIHIKEYQKMIDSLQQEVRTLRGELTLARTGSFSPEAMQGLETREGDAGREAHYMARSPSNVSVSIGECEKAAESIGAEIARLAREREGVAEALFRMDEEIVGCNAEIQLWQSMNVSGVNILKDDDSVGLLEASGVHSEQEIGDTRQESEQADRVQRTEVVSEGRKDKGSEEGLAEGLAQGLDRKRTETTANDVIASLDASWLGRSGELAEAVSEVREQERAESTSGAGNQSPAGPSREPYGHPIPGNEPQPSDSPNHSRSPVAPLGDFPTGNQSEIDEGPNGETSSSGFDEIQDKLKVIEKERARVREDLAAVDDALRALDIRIDREVVDPTKRRVLHLEIALVSAHGGRKEAARAVETRNAVIDEQAEVISSLW
jgi:hypothetical protein